MSYDFDSDYHFCTSENERVFDTVWDPIHWFRSEEDFYEVEPNINFGVLKEMDYSLDSPLIEDPGREFMKLLEGRDLMDRYKVGNWEELGKSFHNLMKPGFIPSLSPVGLNHKHLEDLLNENTEFVEIGKRMLKEVNEDVVETSEPLRAFLAGWTGKGDFVAPIKDINDDYVLSLLGGMLSWHELVLRMNCCSPEESRELDKMGSSKQEGYFNKSNHVTRLQLSGIGDVLVGGGFVILLRNRILIDRNFVLMIKDLFSARFGALASMYDGSVRIEKEELYESLKKIYSIFDDGLSRNGTSMYKGIKLLEGMCTLRFAELAAEKRPLLDLTQEFRDHIESSIQNLEAESYFTEEVYKVIKSLKTVEAVKGIYGCYRHWGHPYINYKNGLRLLKEQTTLKKDVDLKYVDLLASDLAKKVLVNQFKKTKKWALNPQLVEQDHPLKRHFVNNTCPPDKLINQTPDTWHLLPLLKCFEIPEIIDPSEIYSDKSHSIPRSEILYHLRSFNRRGIPSRRVLETMLATPATDWGVLFSDIDKNGIGSEHLVIGLKAKERELKEDGRYFALMSWLLREYFVSTEYLIKTHFVPLFRGLTMADDLTDLNRKMLKVTSGQGLLDYSQVTIANHFDYSKWNNHQRDTSTKPIFKVMDKFLGYSSLISRTHEFFEKSLIYYNDRPDLMTVVGDRVESSDPTNPVAWEGQEGGLEGLRQKGWSIISLLMIEREGRTTNAEVGVLAQGDNQVVCTSYKLSCVRTKEDSVNAVRGMIENNRRLVIRIERAARKLGLIINRDESIQSGDFLVYGKIPIFCGNMLSLDEKRYSRIACLSNDQLPSIANILSSVTTNILTVSHFSPSPAVQMRQLLFFSNLCRRVCEIHNPVLGCSLKTFLVQNSQILNSPFFKSFFIYVDPTLGGVCGTSLTRFLIRMFPDPLTESLSFWKIVFENTESPDWKNFCLNVGNPTLGEDSIESFRRLLEDPLALNLRSGISFLMVLKRNIKEAFLFSMENVKNEIFSSALRYVGDEEINMIRFLRSVKPLFPRFLSEFLASSFLGVANSLIGLFINSRTIKKNFTRTKIQEMGKFLLKSEILNFRNAVTVGRNEKTYYNIWSCSSTHADHLREKSWGSKVLGATIPHPLEMMSVRKADSSLCVECQPNVATGLSYLATTVFPHDKKTFAERGKGVPYLGSRTSETTSLIRPWEKETNIPLLKKAVKLRDSISWLVRPDSALATSILSILKGLTGLEWGDHIEGFKRSGTALHRFACSRQSQGGYAAISPTRLSFVSSTTDSLGLLKEKNYDFLFQALLLHSEITSLELADDDFETLMFHGHVKCRECVREVDDLELETDMEYSHPDVSDILLKWIPKNSPVQITRPTFKLKLGDWNSLSGESKSREIGLSIGFCFGEMMEGGTTVEETRDLFPLSIKGKLVPKDFFLGLVEGIFRAASNEILFRASIYKTTEIMGFLISMARLILNRLVKDIDFQNLIRDSPLFTFITAQPHKVPSSYPVSSNEMEYLIKGCLFPLVSSSSEYILSSERGSEAESRYLWVFSDLAGSSLTGPLILSDRIIRLLRNKKWRKPQYTEIKGIKEALSYYRDPNLNYTEIGVVPPGRIRSTGCQIREGAKALDQVDKKSLLAGLSREKWEEPCIGKISSFPCGFLITDRGSKRRREEDQDQLPQPYNNPVIQMVRHYECPTGAPLKLWSIIKLKKIKYGDFLVGGDGSGGMTNLLLAQNPGSRGIFNTLLNFFDVDLGGSKPEPPSGISEVGGCRERCVNWDTSWSSPTDLRYRKTWKCFESLCKKYNLKISLIVLDMEHQENDGDKLIIDHLIKFVQTSPVMSKIVCIYKTFLSIVLSDSYILKVLLRSFDKVEIVESDYSGFKSSEIYIISTRFRSYVKEDFILDSSRLLGMVRDFNWFKSEEEEFKRMTEILLRDTSKGVPPSLVGDQEVLLSMTLESLGISTRISSLLSKVWVEGSSSYITATLAGFSYIGVTDLLGMEIKRFNSSSPPPSDGVVSRIAVLCLGLLYWKSLSSGDFKLFESGNIILRRGFPFYWQEKFSKGKHSFKWSVSKGSVNKCLRVDDRLREVGNLGRRLLIIHKNSERFPPELKVSENLISFGIPEYKTGHLLTRTPLFRLFKGEYLHGSIIPRYSVDKGVLGVGGKRFSEV